MNKKFIASSILAASIASSVGQGNVLARKSFLARAARSLRDFWNKNKAQMMGTAATVAAYLGKKNTFDVKNIRKVEENDEAPDVVGMARDCSHMFLSMDERDFKDNVRRAEFYQLYSAYKVGYNGFVPLRESQKDKYKRILFNEMERRLNNGDIRDWLDEHWIGVNLNEAKEKLIAYIKRLIRYDPSKGDKGVPIFLGIGSGGSGKSFGFELAVWLLSGVKSGDSLSFVNEDAKAVASKVGGAPSNYQNAGDMPSKTIGKTMDIDRKFYPLLLDESDKSQPGAFGSLLEPINDGMWTWSFNGKRYPITYGVYMTANFRDHSFLEGLESYASRFGVDERGRNRIIKNWLLQAYFKDATQQFSEAFMTRVGDSIAIFRAPLRSEAKEYIDNRIKKTQGSPLVANYFIDNSLTDRQHDKVLDLLYDELKHDSVNPKLSFRELSFGVIPMLDRITTAQNGGVNTNGKNVRLGLDERGRIRADIIY